MKTILKAAAAAVAITALSVSASMAADWKPNGPIKMIIAFSAGGGADTQARLIADEVSSATGWDIQPEQVTGKGGVNALAALKTMPNDGSVIAMVVTESLGYNLFNAKGSGMSPSDFIGLTTTAGFQMGVVAKADKGWKSMADFVAASKEGDALRFGTMSPRLSDLAYLMGEATGANINIVQVKGGKAVMNGIQAGDMDIGFMAGIQAKGVASGDLVNLASALSVPLNQTPDAPTFADLGVAYDSDGYFVFVAPAGMPNDAREALTNALVAGANAGKANAMITKAFGGVQSISGADLDALMLKGFNESDALMKASQ